jgi:homoaconitate hydratase
MTSQKLTLVEKIATRYATSLGPGAVARCGTFVMIRPRHIMTHDNTGAVMPKFRADGRRLEGAAREGA